MNFQPDKLPSHEQSLVLQENHPFIWPTEATKLLITTYSNEKWKLQSPDFRKKNVQLSVTETLNIHGYKVTKEQVENKWKSLNGNYKTTKDRNKMSGAQKHYCQFYEELDQVLREDPDFEPLATASNTTGLVIRQ